MNTRLTLQLRTPAGLLADQDVRSIVAEDASGYFGILPGRLDLVAALPASLLRFVDTEGEAFVALSGGLLALRNGVCRVTAREAELTRDLDVVAQQLDAAFALRTQRAETRRGALFDLEREAMQRVARKLRTTLPTSLVARDWETGA